MPSPEKDARRREVVGRCLDGQEHWLQHDPSLTDASQLAACARCGVAPTTVTPPAECTCGELPSPEKQARNRAVVAAVNLAEAWVEFWESVAALGEATRPLPPGSSVVCEHVPVCRRRDDGWPACAPLPPGVDHG